MGEKEREKENDIYFTRESESGRENDTGRQRIGSCRSKDFACDTSRQINDSDEKLGVSITGLRVIFYERRKETPSISAY